MGDAMPGVDVFLRVAQLRLIWELGGREGGRAGGREGSVPTRSPSTSVLTHFDLSRA
jgi:hypothetical protein